MQEQAQKDYASKPVDDAGLEVLISTIKQLSAEVTQMKIKLFTGNGKNALTTDVELLRLNVKDLETALEDHHKVHDKEARTRLWFISLFVTAMLTIFTAFYMTESPSEKRYNEMIEALKEDLSNNQTQLNLILEKLASMTEQKTE